MSKVAVYKNADDCLCVVHPSPHLPVEFAILLAVPDEMDFILIDASALPDDRQFREAWHINGDAVTVDMERARNIHREQIRKERLQAFLELTATAEIAGDIGDEAALERIKQQRQKLRDAPAHPAFKAAKTTDDLAKIRLKDLVS